MESLVVRKQVFYQGKGVPITLLGMGLKGVWKSMIGIVEIKIKYIHSTLPELEHQQ